MKKWLAGVFVVLATTAQAEENWTSKVARDPAAARAAANPPTCVEFMDGPLTVGRLCWAEGVFTFKGNRKKSAIRFFNEIKPLVEQYVQAAVQDELWRQARQQFRVMDVSKPAKKTPVKKK